MPPGAVPRKRSVPVPPSPVTEPAGQETRIVTRCRRKGPLNLRHDTTKIGIMAQKITIDAAGRLVIPKPLRERFGLSAGSELYIEAEEGGLRLSLRRPEPTLRERDGYLVLDLGDAPVPDVDHRQERDRRLRDLVDFALRR